jgi:hypothetical protein
METQLSETKIVQTPEPKREVHRWSRWCDGDGRLIIVVCLFGHGSEYGQLAKAVQLLNADTETTYDISMAKFQKLVAGGKLVRIHTPIIL